jgi:hypothetical protein
VSCGTASAASSGVPSKLRQLCFELVTPRLNFLADGCLDPGFEVLQLRNRHRLESHFSHPFELTARHRINRLVCHISYALGDRFGQTLIFNKAIRARSREGKMNFRMSKTPKVYLDAKFKHRKHRVEGKIGQALIAEVLHEWEETGEAMRYLRPTDAEPALKTKRCQICGVE